ncbi:hypothetical protein SCG7086_BW_00050 [Chlamydiales bacterium SCGC AG-110-P3]|nr:hypothetical protein SCG7086_BW_00050 [Chlamydiales bacterium SCGC AG-110-P3]
MAIVGGGMTFGIGRLLNDQRFRGGIGKVVDLVGFGQDVMMVYSTEVDIVFKMKEKGLGMTLTSSKKMPPSLASYFDKEHVIDGIRSIAWLDASNIGRNDTATIHLWSPGTKMSRGLLFLSSDRRLNMQGTAWRSIALAGYPAPIALGRVRSLDDLPRHPQDDSEELYPNEIIEEKT